ncbi:sulfite exporter TauE/SafE family protein [Pseudoruegeria sp. SHC-113]|uniref:sulfite exporter TauE/SafE family protein n=1 Tax=Pseudoruegeria sp. SHC-113 TaxID=2855439 RepID=UPI0039647B8D|nr:sulfite exporter TauE/SafE family protein [Pseudoruegeria sp. SHC-113]
MELNLTFFLFAVPAVLYAGISKGGFGSGAAFAAAPLLALVLEPELAVGLMLPLLMLMDVTALKPYWRKWDGPSSKRLILGSLPGIALGALLFGLADADLLRLMLGLVALAFVAFQFGRHVNWIRISEKPLAGWIGYVTGAVAGFTSYISHAGGPPVAIYMLSQNVGKTTYQATSVIVFWAINLFKALPYAVLGMFTAQTLLANVLLAPVAVLGVWIGVRAHNWMPERPFFILSYALLLITGVKLVHDGLF